MDYIEDDFTDALIDTICEKSPSTWYTLMMNLMQHVPKALNLSGSK